MPLSEISSQNLFHNALQPSFELPYSEKSIMTNKILLSSILQPSFELHLNGISCQNLFHTS